MIDTCLLDERIEGGTIQLRPERFDLRDLLDDAVEVFRAAAPDRAFDVRVPAVPVPVHADPRLTEIAVGNLLENAVKYSPQGSTVVVEVAPRVDGVEVAVTDEGPGVPAEDRERVFEKYHRAGNTTGTAGAGLGLHLVRSITDAHGGSVRCDAGAAGGGRFVIWLPYDVTESREMAE